MGKLPVPLRTCWTPVHRGVTPTFTSLDDPSQSTGKRTRDDKDSEEFLHMRTTLSAEMKDFVADSHAKPPHAQARGFLSITNGDLRMADQCFKDTHELLRVVRDAIQGKLDCYS
jgi:hypothetical protein